MELSIELLIYLLSFATACGIVVAELKGIRKDIARLEQKVEKHNSFDRRIIRLETAYGLKNDGNK